MKNGWLAGGIIGLTLGLNLGLSTVLSALTNEGLGYLLSSARPSLLTISSMGLIFGLLFGLVAVLVSLILADRAARSASRACELVMEEPVAESHKHQAPKKCALPRVDRCAARRGVLCTVLIEFIFYASGLYDKYGANRTPGCRVKHYSDVLGAFWNYSRSER